jgi:outer membrane protein, heavy metal efflux system
MQAASLSTPTVQELMTQLDTHPALQAYTAEARAAEAMAEGAMGLPNPRIGAGVENVPVNAPLRFDTSDMSSRSVMVSQDIPGRGLRGARAGVEQSAARLALVRREALRGQLAGELLSALAEYEMAGTLESLLDEQLALLDEREAYLSGRIDAGDALFAELAETDGERAAIDQRRADVTRQSTQALSVLTRLVGEVRTPPPVSPIPPPAAETGETVFHAVRVAQAGVQAAEAGVSVREREFDPIYSVSLSYMNREGAPGMRADDMVSAQLMVSVPLWSRWNQTPRLEAARINTEASRLRLADAARVSADAFRAAAADYAAATRSIAALEARHAALDAALAAARRRYEAGDSSLLPLINTRITQTELRIRLLEQRLAADRAAARMHGLVAGEL